MVWVEHIRPDQHLGLRVDGMHLIVKPLRGIADNLSRVLLLIQARFITIKRANLVDVEEITFRSQILFNQRKLLLPYLANFSCIRTDWSLIVIDGYAVIVADAQSCAVVDAPAGQQAN